MSDGPRRQLRRLSLLLVALFAMLASHTAVHAGTALSIVEGVVRDKATAQPLAEAIVYLNLVSPESAAMKATTDRLGRFRFENLSARPEDEYVLAAAKEGYVPHRPSYYYGSPDWPPSGSVPSGLYRTRDAMRQTLALFKVTKGVVVRSALDLERAGALRGRLQVRTASGIGPYTGGLVLKKRRDSTQESALAGDQFVVKRIVPNAAGEFEVAGLAASNAYFLSIIPAGYAWNGEPFGVSITAGEATEFDRVIELSDPTGLSGRVLIRGAFIPEVAGSLVVRRAGSRQPVCVERLVQGRYSCLAMAAGAYAISAHASHGGVDYVAELNATVSVGATRLLDINLETEDRE